jgi:hypothetical protein
VTIEKNLPQIQTNYNRHHITSSKAFADASGGVAKHFLCVVTVKTVYLTTSPTKMKKKKKTQFLENMALNLKFTQKS